MGHALEFVQADTLARYWRLMGHEVFFNTGVDEHGQKIARKADESKQDRQSYVDYFAKQFGELKDKLDLSYDNFLRTSSLEHKAAARELWQLCLKSGDIYKKRFKGLYCVGCESFKTESDLQAGKCPDHKVEPEEIEEENYFFRLSKYQSYLEDYLSRTDVIMPEWRRFEALKFVKNGLEDFSISREKKRVDWGVSVPNDDNHVMYVWFDALTNYISTLGWPDNKEGEFKKFWLDGEVLQVAGKDQIRFQSIIWQAMLKSAGIKATDKVIYHGFINSGGHKMSKSLGNTISPYELVEKYGTDATRYILLRHVHTFEDTDLTWEKMDEYYTANLVNGLGNLTARIMKMAETNLNPSPTFYKKLAVDRTKNFSYHEAFANFNFQAVSDDVWQKIQVLDEKITETEPFKLVKTDKESAGKIIAELVVSLYEIADLLTPLMPQTSTIIRESVLKNKKPNNLFQRLD